MTQAELAALAGISPRLLRSYEACRSLPQSVQSLLCLTIALKVPFEWLIEPRLLDELRATIEARRAVLAARTRPPVQRRDE
jgi:transcriptional regulator with XRE-family HTH domain